MIRKLTLVFLLFIGLQTIASAQVRDSVTIHIPPYTDTTCLGTQLTFSAIQSSDTFTGVIHHWYVNNVYTGVALDTFYTTALNNNDSVYCWLVFTNSLGNLDSSRSNSITIHHLPSIAPRVLTSLIIGSNPDCAGTPLTFEAYPINGGIVPQYQWLINGTELTGEDSTRLTRVFGGSDTVVCRMISNSPCASPFSDTAYSIPVPIIHIHLTASISMVAVYDSVCQGGVDTFHATASGYGNNVTYQWYINGVPVVGANGFDFYTGTLNDSDSVYVVLNTTDSCVLNPTVVSNVKYIKVRHVYANAASIDLTSGANPGCLGESITFTATLDTFGTAPTYDWFLNGAPYASGVSSITSSLFSNTDIISFTGSTTDGRCYSHYVINVPGVVLSLNQPPQVPVLNLIGDLLSTYNSGRMIWWHNDVDAYGGTTAAIIPGATDTSYHPTMLGYYYIYADSNNCQSQLPSNRIYISLLDVEHITKANINVYPNPTTGIVNMDWSTQVNNFTVNVYNALGQNVYTQTIVNKAHTEANLSALPNGNYYVQVRDQDGQFNTYKIILEHN